MAKEESKTQCLKMVEDFKKSCISLLDQCKPAMDDLEKSAYLNFDNLSEAFRKGSSDMRAQAIKGNQGMIEKFQGNYKELQKTLDDTFAQLRDSDMSQFQSNVSKFTEAFDSTLSKIPLLKLAVNVGADTTTSYLDHKKKDTLDAIQLKLTEATKVLKDSADDTAKKLTLKVEDLTGKGKK